MDAYSPVLAGLKVIELSNANMASAQVGQMLADFGADVVQVEPPSGAALRHHPSYPLWGRGKQSIGIDLKTSSGRAWVLDLISKADVVVQAFGPGVAERLGVGYRAASSLNSRLVYASISGWGDSSPYVDVPGYEGLVMAKLGAMHAYAPMANRPGPAYVSTPYATTSAAQATLQGILAALYERETSGLGQHVTSNLALAVASLDPFRQMVYVITSRFPEAFSAAEPFASDGTTRTDFSLRLLVAVTSDGTWLHFALTQPRLFRAFMASIDMSHLLDDPEWGPVFSGENRARLGEANNLLLEAVRRKSLAEWQEIFEREHNVFAEIYREGTELLHHPQVVYERQAIEVRDPAHGRTLQPAPMVRFSKSASEVRPAPRLNVDRGAVAPTWEVESPSDARSGTSGLPLAGLTVLELGTFYAAPYGVALLTDLGARVIKVETPEGDPMRTLQPFPESGGAKVLQGKESVAADLHTPEGVEIAYRLADKADLVMCAFRAGVAQRLGLDSHTLLERNPNLMYLDSPGYGVSGPYGDRAAFAATISAGTGVALRNLGRRVGETETMTAEQLRLASVALTTAANSGGTTPDGIAALAVATAGCLALYARRRGLPGQELMTTMLLSTAHALSETMVEYQGRVEPLTVDEHHFGLHARYRLYQGSEGWIFLAVPSDSDWARFVDAMSDVFDFAGDVRWRTADSRREHDDELAQLLESVFSQRSASDWETTFAGRGVGCVVAEERRMEEMMMGEFGHDCAYAVDVVSPIFDEHPRVAPLMGFSRSTTQALPGCTIGQHTQAVLRELGYADDEIAEMYAKSIVV